MAGVNIHIPFCKSFCSYCDFYSITDNSLKETLVQSVISEASARSSYLEGEEAETVYFGGGTPSLLEPESVARIIEALRKNFVFAADPEITIEVNPDDVYEGFFRDMHQAGVNRVSIGVQSWNDKTIALPGAKA
jgi:oxygen-independent coproporphyrinogen-3 oxidase